MLLVSLAHCETSCTKSFRCQGPCSSQTSFRDKLQKTEASFTGRNTFSWFLLTTFQRLSDNLNLEAFLHPPI